MAMANSENPRRDYGVAMTSTTRRPSFAWLTMLCSCVVLSTYVSSGLWAQAGSASDPTGPPATSSAPVPASAQDANTAKPHDGSYLIGNDDVLAINVWKEPDISRSVPVRSDGRISLPLVGEVQAAGQTPHQLEADIASKLKNYISEPEVTVIVQEIRSQKFNILGMVTRPGEFPLTNSMTVLDAIALAGGFRDFAKQKSIYILRQNPDGTQAHLPFNYKDVVKGKNPDQNVKLRARDTIVIP
jgi:polysaccharide biosynthesis/export protein